MEFRLWMSLDNDEARQLGESEALALYIAQLAERFSSGPAQYGSIRDGNGNTIGSWRITNDD